MYYINLLMKNTKLKLIEYVYYFSFIVLLILYLFPGSLIGYLLYGNLGKQPDFIPNPIGTSINHLIYFSYITVLAILIRPQVKNIFTDYKVILVISIILEIFHLIIPNRAFEFLDLTANFIGVVLVLLIKNLKNV